MDACETLACVALDIEKRLATDPAWLALRQLDDRIDEGRPVLAVDQAALRARLLARVDASVPAWQLLDAVNAAVAVLDAGLREAHPPLNEAEAAPASVVAAARPPPLAGPHQAPLAAWPREPADAPHEDVATILRRIRPVDEHLSLARSTEPALEQPVEVMSETSRPAAAQPTPAIVEDRPLAVASKADLRAEQQAPPAPTAAVLPQSPPTSAARLLALEVEVERLVTGDLASISRGHLDADAGVAEDPYPLDIADGRELLLEEAVVEIITSTDTAYPATAETTHPDEDAWSSSRDPAISLQAHLDEASVEIVPVDAITPEPARPAGR